VSEQAELFPEPTAPAPSAEELFFRVGPHTLRLVPYARDCWRSVEGNGALVVRKQGKSWRAGLAVGLEHLGPYADEMLTFLARGRGASLKEAEASLNGQLDRARRLIGGPTA
jgi:hypothetical protein